MDLTNKELQAEMQIGEDALGIFEDKIIDLYLL